MSSSLALADKGERHFRSLFASVHWFPGSPDWLRCPHPCAHPPPPLPVPPTASFLSPTYFSPTSFLSPHFLSLPASLLSTHLLVTPPASFLFPHSFLSPTYFLPLPYLLPVPSIFPVSPPPSCSSCSIPPVLLSPSCSPTFFLSSTHLTGRGCSPLWLGWEGSPHTPTPPAHLALCAILQGACLVENTASPSSSCFLVSSPGRPCLGWDGNGGGRPGPGASVCLLSHSAHILRGSLWEDHTPGAGHHRHTPILQGPPVQPCILYPESPEP